MYRPASLPPLSCLTPGFLAPRLLILPFYSPTCLPPCPLPYSCLCPPSRPLALHLVHLFCLPTYLTCLPLRPLSSPVPPASIPLSLLLVDFLCLPTHIPACLLALFPSLFPSQCLLHSIHTVPTFFSGIIVIITQLQDLPG